VQNSVTVQENNEAKTTAWDDYPVRIDVDSVNVCMNKKKMRK